MLHLRPPNASPNSVLEASKVVSTKTPVLKHYYSPERGLAALGEAVLVAVSRHKEALKQDVFQDVATPTLTIALVASSILHVASLSDDTFAMFVVGISLSARSAWATLASRTYRNSSSRAL